MLVEIKINWVVPIVTDPPWAYFIPFLFYLVVNSTPVQLPILHCHNKLVAKYVICNNSSWVLCCNKKYKINKIYVHTQSQCLQKGIISNLGWIKLGNRWSEDMLNIICNPWFYLGNLVLHFKVFNWEVINMLSNSWSLSQGPGLR